MALQGQTYTALWKQAEEAEKKDLPRTQYDVLMKIVKKAQKEGQYGQLLAAELAGSRVMTTISPDSLQPAVERIAERRQQTKDKALHAVYTVVLKKIYDDNQQLERSEDYTVTLDDETCARLAAVKAADYKPLTVEGKDSRWFDNDLLSVVGYELNDYAPLHLYYNKVGNRLATMMTALELARADRYNHQLYLQKLDSLLTVYGDLPEAGELAIERYHYMDDDHFTPEQRWNYTEEALKRWGSYSRMNELRNAQSELTQKKYNAELGQRVVLPNREQQMKLKHLRGIDQLTVRFYQADVKGNTELSPNNEKDYKKLKSLLKELPYQIHRSYTGKKAYELFEDSVQIPALPVGVYMIEVESKPATEVSRRLYFVSNVRTMQEALPGNSLRYVVVDAEEGQPVKGASIELTGYLNGRRQTLTTLTTDGKGEATFHYEKSRPTSVYTYTKTDKACPSLNGYGNFTYYDNQRRMEQTLLYADRAIYRPGQTVHVAAIAYEVENGFEQKAMKGKKLTLNLRDANYKVVDSKQVITDSFGTGVADFTLPSNGLTGQFTVETTNGSCYFRVEEYKRPTFEVTFDKVTADYKDGDTLTVKGTARSYAGVPVQDAKVKYSIVRRASFWWWASVDEEEVADGEAMTDADGNFTVQMPMVLPKTEHTMFYNFVCMADVTDQGGETHQGQLSLPLGNRKKAFSVDYQNKMRADQTPKMTFHLRNAAGNDMSGEVKYRYLPLTASQGGGTKWLTAKTNTRIELPKLKSGRYEIEAECEGERLKEAFTIFNLDDQRPAFETDDWFYVSDTKFANDGPPVTVQVGSSAQDVHIVYSIISGDSVIESGAVDRSNQLINRKLTYKPEYGNGLLLTFAWVKQGKFYSHQAQILRPLPDKQLKLEWQTFRDRLTPGQQEEWTLTVKKPDGSPADAQLMATLYDKSLDQIAGHDWGISLYRNLPLPNTRWAYPYWGGWNFDGSQKLKYQTVVPLDFSYFDHLLFPQRWMTRSRGIRVGSQRGMMAKAAMAVSETAMVEESKVFDCVENAIGAFEVSDDKKIEAKEESVQLRENLQETAFFYPQLQADSEGRVALKFTLPESLTTWRFMGLAHTADMCYGQLEGEAVAQKDLMVQPNMPRFLREGDQATISARVINTCERDLSGTAYLTLTDPETDKTVLSQEAAFTVKVGETTSVQFTVDNLPLELCSLATKGTQEFTIGNSLLIAKVVATTGEFSDGEQHYLPILPNRERVTVTVPFTQNEPGTKTIDLTKLFEAPLSSPEGDTNVLQGNEAPSGAVGGAKLTIEYTNHPAWLMIQALPAIGHPYDDCAICQAASLYANSIGKHIIDQVPQAKTVFEQWKREQGEETSLHSQLEKNQELKDLVLNETPWVADADRETEQRQRLADFFDENLMQQRLSSAVEKLGKLQRGDGSWSWWPEMPGSVFMTMAVAEMMVRQQQMTGELPTAAMLKKAFKFLGNEMVDLVKELKKQEKKGYKPSFPGRTALEWLYICKLDGRTLPSDVQQANDYLIKLLKKETKNQSIYEKAMSAIILDSPLYIKSLKEYTVYKEEMGRYYDTPRAGYSWRDYRIPTQVAAIEAIQRLTPDDQQTLDEMRRWLLQEKRTQAWDTPLNSVDAVYAFMGHIGPMSPMGHIGLMGANADLSLDGKAIETPKATAGIGYVKTAQPYQGEKTFTANKTSEGTSWGAVYAQFMQTTSDIKDQASGVSVKREVLDSNLSPLSSLLSPLKIGSRVTVRLTIQSERDLDFVQIQDRRAACMEPVRQLSGYDWHLGCYVTPRDNVTNYYFDRLAKGKHVIETEYYIDRAGKYETGTCTVQCAYASEYRGTTKSQTIKVE